MEQDKKQRFHLNLENSKYPKLKKWLEIGLILLLVFVISIITLSDANPTTNPPGRDGGFFLYVGKALRSGAKLYEDIWDSKGPLSLWINALGVEIFPLGALSNRISVFCRFTFYRLLVY